MLWRRQVLQEYKYDEWFQGYSYFEDVDFSYRVSRKYKLMIVADAKVQHLSPPVKEDRDYALGKCQVINRKYFLVIPRVRRGPTASESLRRRSNAMRGPQCVEPARAVLPRILNTACGIQAAFDCRE
jgi:hypothetical protein